jgi:hypothetical protein
MKYEQYLVVTFFLDICAIEYVNEYVTISARNFDLLNFHFECSNVCQFQQKDLHLSKRTEIRCETMDPCQSKNQSRTSRNGVSIVPGRPVATEDYRHSSLQPTKCHPHTLEGNIEWKQEWKSQDSYEKIKSTQKRARKSKAYSSNLLLK